MITTRSHNPRRDRRMIARVHGEQYAYGPRPKRYFRKNLLCIHSATHMACRMNVIYKRSF